MLIHVNPFIKPGDIFVEKSPMATASGTALAEWAPKAGPSADPLDMWDKKQNSLFSRLKVMSPSFGSFNQTSLHRALW